MDKVKVLDEIFGSDPLNMLNFEHGNTNHRTADERLLASFQEINDFLDRNGQYFRISTILSFEKFKRR